MVKKIVLIAILIPFLLITGCELLGLTDDEEDDEPSIYGTWVYTYDGWTMTLVLKKDDTYTYYDDNGNTDTGTFIYGDTTFMADSDSGSDYDWSGTYTLDGDILILDGDAFVRQ